MFQDALQNRAHNGEQAAFRDIYNRYSREVYAVSHTALGSADDARAVVKQVFLHLYRELMRSESDLDLPARLSALTNEEIRIMRIAAGELDPESLLVQYSIASAPAVDTEHTMERIRAHMQQAAAPAEEAPAAEPAAAPVEEATAECFEETFQEPAAADFFAEPKTEPETAKEPAEEAPTEPAVSEKAAFVSEPLTETPKKKKHGGSIVAGFILLVLLVVFAWLIVGILMDLAILPFRDFGYSLFNEYVFDFFRLP